MDVEIAMTAWTNNPARIGYFETTLRSMKELLSTGEIVERPTLVCSEELEHPVRERFELICGAYNIQPHYHPAPAEIGSNHNFLLARCAADYVMFVEDDCPLVRPLDLAADVQFLEDNHDFVMVRYYVGQTNAFTAAGDLGNGLVEVGKSSNYTYSNTPHLRHRERFATLGAFAENVGWGCQEHAMGDKLQESPLRIAVRQPNHFAHAGLFGSQPERWPEGETP